MTPCTCGDCSAYREGRREREIQAAAHELREQRRQLAREDRAVALELAAQHARAAGVEAPKVLGRSRRAPIVAARRRVVCELAARGWSTIRIGRAIGRDRATVRHHLEREAAHA